MMRLAAIVAAAALAVACSDAVSPGDLSEEDAAPPAAPAVDEIPPDSNINEDDPMSRLPLPCEPQEKLCATPNMAAICEEDGQSWRPAHCGAEQHCEDGACLPGTDI